MTRRESLESVLLRFAEAYEQPRSEGHGPRDTTPLFADLVDQLRPDRPEDGNAARERLHALCYLLETRPELQAALRQGVLDLFAQKKQVSLYVDSGVFPATGFFSETARRFSRSLLPDVIDTAYLKDVLGLMFRRGDDHLWVSRIGDGDWIGLIHAMGLLEAEDTAPGSALPPALAQLLEALRVLSYRISAIGLEPELLRVEPVIEEFESPFLAQNVEIQRFVGQFSRWWQERDFPAEDDRQILVLFDQCRTIRERIRTRAGREGTSLSLTFLLQRLRQHLERAETLLEILRDLREAPDLAGVLPRLVPFFKELVQAECRKNNLGDYWRQNVELLARRVADNAGRTGEHYITESRRDYFALLRSALLGGFVIAFMAWNKLELAKLHLPPLTEALSFCLNYGLGFVLIHILHGTVATKQPAMTANAIAASMDEASGANGSNAKARNLENLVSLIARLGRSQMAAIAGNVGLAIPMAMAIGYLFQLSTGHPLITPEKARHLLADVHPWASGAIIYAGIAGVCLFLAGLIAGYYDNLAAYNRIPQRLRQLGWLRRLLGEDRLDRVATYVEDNLGALAGNFFFGFLLGGVTALGTLLGLPLDIRHIAFSSAYLGFGEVALNFAVPTAALATAFLGVLAVGLANLSVSFGLALYVGLKARQVSFAQRRDLARLLWERLRHHPREFFLPPKH